MELLILNYSVQAWELLAVLGVLLVAFEIFAPGFVLLPIGLAFIIASIASLFLTSWLSILTSLAVSLCFLIWLFHFKLKMHGKSFSAASTNADGMLGQEVVVIQKIEGDFIGEVKLYGDRWRAYSLSHKTYEIGERAVVVNINGNKLALD